MPTFAQTEIQDLRSLFPIKADMPWKVRVTDGGIWRQAVLFKVFLWRRFLRRPDSQEKSWREPLPSVPVLQLQPLPGIETLKGAQMGVRSPESADDRIPKPVILIEPLLDGIVRFIARESGDLGPEDVRNNWFSQGW